MSVKLNPIEAASATMTLSAPAWMPFLQDINIILTSISLTVGICFTLFIWRRAWLKSKQVENIDPRNEI